MDEPHTTVKVGFHNADYQSVCERYGGGWGLWPRWRELGNLLAGRPGWHFDVVNGGEALWSLGLFGESHFNIDIDEEGRFHCFDHAAEQEEAVGAVAQVEQWLAGRNAGSDLRPSEFARSLARNQDWGVFKLVEVKILVSWSDGAFAAALPHNFEPSISPVLADAVRGVAEMACRLYDAPVELASELTLHVELDSTAARQLQQPSR